MDEVKSKDGANVILKKAGRPRQPRAKESKSRKKLSAYQGLNATDVDDGEDESFLVTSYSGDEPSEINVSLARSAAEEDSIDHTSNSSTDSLKAKTKKRKSSYEAKRPKSIREKLRKKQNSDKTAGAIESDFSDDGMIRSRDRGRKSKHMASELHLLQNQISKLGFNHCLAAHQHLDQKLSKSELGLEGIDRRSLGVDERKAVKSKKAKEFKEAEPGSKIAYKRLDHLWDESIHNYKLTPSSEIAQGAEQNEWDKYVFTVRRRFDYQHKYLSTYVEVKSKPLKECLQHLMKGAEVISLSQDTPQIDPRMLFVYLEDFQNYFEKLRTEALSSKAEKKRDTASTKAAHLRVLMKYLDKDYAETKKNFSSLLKNNSITFDLLWALFKPNTIACCSIYGDENELRAFKVDQAVEIKHPQKGVFLRLEGKYLDYDGKQFGMASYTGEILSYQGARKISSLSCFPLKYHKDSKNLRASFVDRGKQFVALQGMNYKAYQGMAYTITKKGVLKININGRIMIDPAIHRRVNPNYPSSSIKPGDEESSEEDSENSTEISDGDETVSSRSTLTPSSSEDVSDGGTRYKIIPDGRGNARIVKLDDNNDHRITRQGNEPRDAVKASELLFSEEELLIASPVVLGFAFGEKMWLEFRITGLSEVVFNHGAFDSLVLPEKQKSIIKALVSSHAFHPSRNIDDIISGKGKGLVTVLHGPPGTGKTLTAEGIADLLKCPLYTVSAGDLGTDPGTLEKELQRILDIAHSWGAILLLDEADIFLERRSILDINRNALVSIFLRLLEYFQGILFLTTNRVETFDEAFSSRIHLSLRYSELATKAKKSVWKMFLTKIKTTEGLEIEEITEADLSNLARRDVNGRQIKNLVRAAQALAVHEGKPLNMAHIERVLDVAESFERDLKGGSGYTDAMRSYT